MSSFKRYVTQHEIFLALLDDRDGPYDTVSKSLRKFGDFFIGTLRKK
jgi:hypothetical protein